MSVIVAGLYSVGAGRRWHYASGGDSTSRLTRQWLARPATGRVQGVVATGPYDQANRLTTYGASATYAYNGDGLRMSETVAGVVEPFAWDVGQLLPLLLKDAATSYGYDSDGLPVEQISAPVL